MNDQLGRRTARGAGWSIGSQAVVVFAGFLSTAILARLVSPDDFGLVAMVVAVIGFGELLRDFGLTNAVIQAPSITRDQKTNLFWVNTAIGLVLTILVFCLSSTIASFYQNEDVTKIVQVLSITFLINGIATQPRANLIRDLRNKEIAIVDVASVSVAFVLSVALAVGGAGVWALVGLQLGRIVATLAASMIADRFVPRLPRRSVSIRGFIQFGMLTFAARVPVFFSMNIDSVLVGRYLGAELLGFYSRAHQLALMPTQQLVGPLSRVMLPTLSRLHDSSERYNQVLLRSQSIVTTIASIGYAFVIVFAAEIIRVFLGPDWSQVVPIFQVLALVGMIDSAHNLTYWVFVSKGIPEQHLYYSLFGRPILVVMIILAVSHGVMTVAWTHAIWIAVAWVFGVYWAGRSSEIPVGTMITAGCRTFIVSLVLMGAGLFARDQMENSSQITDIVLSSSMMFVMYGAIVVVSSHIRQDVRDTVSVLRYFKRSTTLPMS